MNCASLSAAFSLEGRWLRPDCGEISGSPTVEAQVADIHIDAAC